MNNFGHNKLLSSKAEGTAWPNWDLGWMPPPLQNEIHHRCHDISGWKKSEKTTSAYIDNLYINEDIVSVTSVAVMLWIDKQNSRATKKWSLNTWLNCLMEKMTFCCGCMGMHFLTSQRQSPGRRYFCSKLVGHFSVCGWLQVAAGVIKHSDERFGRSNQLLSEWSKTTNVEASDVLITKNFVWVDTSSLATWVLLELCRFIIEGACWLQPESNMQHINFSVRCYYKGGKPG